MKKTLIILTTVCIFTVSGILTSCKTAAEKNIAKKENVEQAKADLALAQREVAIQKAENKEEWNAFKEDSKIRVANNNKSIADLKEKMLESGSKYDEAYANKIADLEKQNRKLDISLETFENSKSSDWRIFKRNFDQGMNDLLAALKSLASND